MKRHHRCVANRLFAALVLAVTVTGCVLVYGCWMLNRHNLVGKDKTIMIHRGASAAAIAGALEAKDIIPNARLFVVALLATGNAAALKAGEYCIPAGSSMADIMARLVGGITVTHKITIPEGLTSAQIVQRLRNEPMLTGAIEVTPPEGRLLPETYSFKRGDMRQALLERMASSRNALLQVLWAGRNKSIAAKTPEDAVILASIVEKETSLADERPKIAAVLYNRLKNTMRLQSDPTVIYGIIRGNGSFNRELTSRDLAENTPYNTYRIDGLPPTPITNPGRAALKAAMNPAKTKALYFVADGHGGHVFADTLPEHRQAVRLWRGIEQGARNQVKRDE
ncbi:MAG: endolytic transglycosylase MltG [Hyphomicrobiales bacterium]